MYLKAFRLPRIDAYIFQGICMLFYYFQSHKNSWQATLETMFPSDRSNLPEGAFLLTAV